jgi:hypothetical protein
VPSEVRNEVTRIILAAGMSGEISNSEKAYMAQTVSRQTGLSPDQANQRVEALVKQRNETVATARATADRARKASIIMAFITAAALLLAAAAGWFAAGLGGKHRDEETDIPFFHWR